MGCAGCAGCASEEEEEEEGAEEEEEGVDSSSALCMDDSTAFPSSNRSINRTAMHMFTT